MEEDSCPFSLLPATMLDTFLLQAFSNLDQQQLHCVVPLVCRQWHLLAPHSSKLLVTRPSTPLAIRSLYSWMLKHDPALDSIDLDMTSAMISDDTRQLATIIGSVANQLCSLRMALPIGLAAGDPLNASCCNGGSVAPELTQLTHLEVQNPDSPTLDHVLRFQQLRSLSIWDFEWPGHMGPSFPPKVASSLTHLTSLTLSKTSRWVEVQQLLVRTSLPRLQQLNLGHTPVPCEALASLQPLPISSIRVRVAPLGGIDATAAWLQQSARRLEGLDIDFILLWEQEGLVGSDVGHLLDLLSPAVGPLLHKLKLEDCHDLAGSLSHLYTLTQLTSLTLHSCNLNDSALRGLSTLSSLRELDVRFNLGVKGKMKSLCVLADSMPHLTCLRVPKSVPRMEVLNAFGSRVLRDTGLLYALAPASNVSRRVESKGTSWWRRLLQ